MDLDIQKIISNVPLIRLKCFEDNEVYVLLEKFNLSGSIKIKTVYWILKDALEKGNLTKDKIILEASSGNTAIALAFLAKILGIKVLIILPNFTASCKKKLIKSYGAEILEIEGNTDECIKYRDILNAKDPDKYFLPDQFGNYANLWSHYNLTGPYLSQSLGELDFVCAGLGTSGTILGTGLYLKKIFADIQILAVNPIEKIEGLRDFNISTTKIPFYDQYKYLINEYINVNFDDAIAGVDDLLHEGYFVGISSGAAFAGLEKYLNKKKGLKGVLIAPDGGDYYFETLIKYINLKNYRGCQ